MEFRPGLAGAVEGAGRIFDVGHRQEWLSPATSPDPSFALLFWQLRRRTFPLDIRQEGT